MSCTSLLTFHIYGLFSIYYDALANRFYTLSVFAVFTVRQQSLFFELHTKVTKFRTKVYFSIFVAIELTRIYAFWYVLWNMVPTNVQQVYLRDDSFTRRYTYISVMVCTEDPGMPD